MIEISELSSRNPTMHRELAVTWNGDAVVPALVPKNFSVEFVFRIRDPTSKLF